MEKATVEYGEFVKDDDDMAIPNLWVMCYVVGGRKRRAGSIVLQARCWRAVNRRFIGLLLGGDKKMTTLPGQRWTSPRNGPRNGIRYRETEMQS